MKPNWITTLIVAALIGIAGYAALFLAPTERTMGLIQRIFYFHVPSAWAGFVAFFITFIASVAYLLRRAPKWDWLAVSSAEVGVAFFTVADLVKPRPEATHVFFKSYDGYSTNNPLAVCLDDDVLIAHKWNGHPLPREHGGPARLIIPKRYAWKGAKFIREIVFLDRDILGFWEVRGYSNTADPWAEDRFA